MVLAHRERLTPQAGPGRSWPAAGCATTPKRPAPGPAARARASTRGTTRSTPRPCCPTAPPPRRRSRACCRPRHGPRRRPALPTRRHCGAEAVAARTSGRHRAPRRRPTASDRTTPTTPAHDARPAIAQKGPEPMTPRLPRPLGDPVHHRRRRRADPPQRDRGVHVRRADAQRLQPRPRHLRQAARQPRRPDRGVLRDGRRRGRGRRRAGDHHDHLPDPPLGLGRRRRAC